MRGASDGYGRRDSGKRDAGHYRRGAERWQRDAGRCRRGACGGYCIRARQGERGVRQAAGCRQGSAGRPPAERRRPPAGRWQLFSVLTKIFREFHFRSGFSAVPWQLFSVLTKWAPPIWSKPNIPASEGSKSGVRDEKTRVGLVKTEKSCQGRPSVWRDGTSREITGVHFRRPRRKRKGGAGRPRARAPAAQNAQKDAQGAPTAVARTRLAGARASQPGSAATANARNR